MTVSRGITLDTVGALIDGGHEITGYCSDCKHGGTVDLRAVAALKGRDWITINKRWPIKCSACGSRRTTVRLGVAGRPGMSR